MTFFVNLLCSLNILLISIVCFVSFFQGRFLSPFAIAMISLQVILNVYFLKFNKSRLVKFYILLFFTYFMQNLIFWPFIDDPTSLMGTWFHVPSLSLSTSAFDKTFLFLTIAHAFVLVVMGLLVKNDGSFLKDHFIQNVDYKKLNILIIVNIFLFGLYFLLPQMQLGANQLYIINIARRFLMNVVCIDIIIVFLLISCWQTLSKKTILLAMAMLFCQVIFSTLMGARHGVILFGFLVLLNLITGSIKYRFKKVHIVWIAAIFVIFLIQYDLGTRSRINQPTGISRPLSYHFYRFSSRLSGIDYVHLFLNFDSPEKKEKIHNELLLTKRIKAGVNRFIGARVYNEQSLALLFEYFYFPNFKTITSSLKNYNSDMPTWFGESYLYFKNSTIAFGIIGFSTLLLTLIYNSLYTKVSIITFLWLFHEFFVSFGFFDWYLPETLSVIISMNLLIWFLSNKEKSRKSYL